MGIQLKSIFDEGGGIPFPSIKVWGLFCSRFMIKCSHIIYLSDSPGKKPRLSNIKAQYSDGNNTVVYDLSYSVMIQILLSRAKSPAGMWYTEKILPPS